MNCFDTSMSYELTALQNSLYKINFRNLIHINFEKSSITESKSSYQPRFRVLG